MKTMNQETHTADAEIKDRSAAVAEPALGRPGLVALAANFLTPVIIRAAQNYMACRLEDWLCAIPIVGTG